MGATA